MTHRLFNLPYGCRLRKPLLCACRRRLASFVRRAVAGRALARFTTAARDQHGPAASRRDPSVCTSPCAPTCAFACASACASTPLPRALLESVWRQSRSSRRRPRGPARACACERRPARCAPMRRACKRPSARSDARASAPCRRVAAASRGQPPLRSARERSARDRLELRT